MSDLEKKVIELQRERDFWFQQALKRNQKEKDMQDNIICLLGVIVIFACAIFGVN